MIDEMLLIEKTTNVQELFGKNEKRAKNIYRRYARMVHPDMFSLDNEKAQAEKSFKKLNNLWDTYCHKSGSIPSPAKPKKNTIKTRKREYSLGEKVEGDPFYNRFNATYDDGHIPVMALITANNTDSDLAENHIEKIQEIKDKVSPDYLGFYPHFVEAFKYTDGGTTHQGIIQTRHDEFVPFSEIMEKYPNGINGRNLAWIFKRMLVAVGNVHEIGLVHGAIGLDSFYVNAPDHGVILDDWQYARHNGETLVAVPEKLRSEYPEKYLKKAELSHSLDINLCAKLALKLLSDDEPKQLRIFLKVCLKEKTMTAKELLYEFNLLLERLYGPPKFSVLTL